MFVNGLSLLTDISHNESFGLTPSSLVALPLTCWASCLASRRTATSCIPKSQILEGGSVMAFSRVLVPNGPVATDVLTADMVGIGMNFAAPANTEPNIEDTLLF